MVVAVKTARCGMPVFALIEIERMMMRAGRRPDAMCLWRNLRRLVLVDCSEGPWEGNEEGESAEERNEVGMNERTTAESDEI